VSLLSLLLSPTLSSAVSAQHAKLAPVRVTPNISSRCLSRAVDRLSRSNGRVVPRGAGLSSGSGAIAEPSALRALCGAAILESRQ